MHKQGKHKEKDVVELDKIGQYRPILLLLISLMVASIMWGCVPHEQRPTNGAVKKEEQTSAKDKELEEMEERIESSPFLITADYFRKSAGNEKTIKLFGGRSEEDKKLEERLKRIEERLKDLPYRNKDENGMPVLRRRVVLLSLLGDLGLEILTRLPEALRKTDGVIPVDTGRLTKLLQSEGMTVADLVKTSARRHIANLAGIQAFILVSFPNGTPIQGKKSMLRIDVIHGIESVLIGSYLGTIDDFDEIAKKISADVVRATEWSCRVIKVDQGYVYLNAGRLTGVRPGDRFEVYARGKEIVDPVTQRTLGIAPGEFKGVIEVDALFGTDASRAKIISGDGFKTGDLVKILELS